jgi:5-methylcytosine-specific restriction endonuclease McrA
MGNMGALISIARELQSEYRPEPLDRDSAHERLVTLARRRAADDVAMLEPLLMAAQERVHELLGLGSFHEYCARLFGWGGRQTRERLRVARAMRELPRIRERWAAGELSYSVVRELTRVATAEVEAEWLAWASPEGGARRTGHEAQRMAAKHVRGDRPSDPPAPFAEQRVRIVLEASGSEAARLSEVRAEATRRLRHSVSDETLVKMLFDAFLGGAARGDSGAPPAQVRLTVCERCGATERECAGEGRVPVDPVIGEVARCDATVLREGERARQTVSPVSPARNSCRVPVDDRGGGRVTRRRRTGRSLFEEVDARDPLRGPLEPGTNFGTGILTLRRAVSARDEGTCAAPGCKQGTFVALHHVRRRADGGAHAEENLVSLCSVHHERVHRGELVVRSAPEGFVFERADGRPYGAVGAPGELDDCRALAATFVRVTERTGSEVRARAAVDLRLHRGRGARGTAGPAAEGEP